MAENAFYATGYGGQIIAVVPAKWLVAGQAVDLKRNSKGAVESVSNQRFKLRIWRAEADETENYTYAIAL